MALQKLCLSRFQFHFGSIGSGRFPAFGSSSIKFQFHFGSIGSDLDPILEGYCRVSIPLWFDWKLKSCAKTSVKARFNSTLVRLEAPEGEAFMLRFFVSIPLWFDWKFQSLFINLFLIGFNSTLVRLEDSSNYCTILVYTVSIPLWFDWKLHTTEIRLPKNSFNSTLVRLEEHLGLVVKPLPKCFNSTLVRLEAFLKCNHSRPFLVSIPLWFDWK